MSFYPKAYDADQVINEGADIQAAKYIEDLTASLARADTSEKMLYTALGLVEILIDVADETGSETDKIIKRRAGARMRAPLNKMLRATERATDHRVQVLTETLTELVEWLDRTDRDGCAHTEHARKVLADAKEDTTK